MYVEVERNGNKRQEPHVQRRREREKEGERDTHTYAHANTKTCKKRRKNIYKYFAKVHTVICVLVVKPTWISANKAEAMEN